MPSKFDDLTVNSSILRGRLTKFLGNGTPWKRPLQKVLQKIEQKRWRAAIFGGVLRDLALFGPAERPRDVDIVLADTSDDAIAELFGQWMVRRTRFGGVHLIVDNWLFDVWDISSTWGINQLGLQQSFSELPKTTFLNVEAVVAEIKVAPGRERKIYSHTFFQALESRVLDINFMENPFPALCVIRSLLTAARLNFDIGHSLAEYIVAHARREGVTQLVQIQHSHYGTVRADEARLDTWIAAIERQLMSGGHTARLPLERGEQLAFANFWTPTV